jgi:peroxiredoxin
MQRLKVLAGLTVMLAGLGVRGGDLEIGVPAPAFSLTDTAGHVHNLADYRGKSVVLEWINVDCPFVRKHYNTQNMQTLQQTYTEKGVVWLSICSSAPGKQGYYAAAAWPALIEKNGIRSTAVLLDADGTAGRLYGARTTPHLYVIDPAGILVYQGAIDDNPSWDPETVAGAKNHVAAALDALLEGRAVETPEAKPYGCSVKY